MEYIAFLDESYVTASRYRSISCCSLERRYVEQFSRGLGEIVRRHGLKEFKWTELKSVRSLNCARALLAYFFEKLSLYQLRLDILTWDTHDSRHDVIGRDDQANFERMFFHLLSASIKRRAIGASWRIKADQRNGVDWATIRDCLQAVGSRASSMHCIFDSDLEGLYGFDIQSFETVESHQCAPVQLADLFAGVSGFSGENYAGYESWLRNLHGQIDLFDQPSGEQYSNRERYRFEFLRALDGGCKARSLGVSLNSLQMLRTFDGKKPLNFWLYQPQHEADKAPTRMFNRLRKLK